MTCVFDSFDSWRTETEVSKFSFSDALQWLILKRITKVTEVWMGLLSNSYWFETCSVPVNLKLVSQDLGGKLVGNWKYLDYLCELLSLVAHLSCEIYLCYKYQDLRILRSSEKKLAQFWNYSALVPSTVISSERHQTRFLSLYQNESILW